jgi:RNA:NAD 2'-phosphotransferase (TPT1/KptA family)
VNEESGDLRALQDAIYRDKVMRARSMTSSERLDEALELSNDIYGWMLDGAKSQCGLTTDEEGWAEVERRLDRLRRLHEHGIYQPVIQ